MISFIQSLPKHFMTALRNLGRHMAMTLSSASAVAVTLTLMTLFLVLAANMNSFADHVETNLKIHASIDSLQKQDEIEHMEKLIKGISGVKTVEFSSKEDELNILIEESGSVFERYKERNPMPNVFIVEVEKATDIPQITKTLNNMEGIEKAQYGGESIQDMIDTFETIRYGGAVFILALGVLAIFLITNTIKMTIYTRQTEISIMRNVGAGNWYIKTPFMFEGMLIGMIGALIPVILTIFGYGFFYDFFGGQFMSSMFVMQKPYPFTLQIAGVLFLSGAVVGIIGSFLAATKYLRWRR